MKVYVQVLLSQQRYHAMSINYSRFVRLFTVRLFNTSTHDRLERIFQLTSTVKLLPTKVCIFILKRACTSTIRYFNNCKTYCQH